ncbi:MAG: YhbY family RNA-binding protein [Oscillospiraceae bacterium]|nr:YhbY family RNA-binding protein [Oscillospiraceae bacterium]
MEKLVKFSGAPPLTSKARAELRARANGLEPVLAIGKGGLGESVAASADAALTARELIKARVLETCPDTAAECAASLSAALGAEVIQVIGRRFTLYRYNPELHEPKPEPPKPKPARKAGPKKPAPKTPRGKGRGRA